MTKRPQILENVRYEGDIDVINHPDVQTAVAGWTEKLADRGRILLRLSGTEPLVRIMVEGNDQAEVETVVSSLVTTVKEVIGISAVAS